MPPASVTVAVPVEVELPSAGMTDGFSVTFTELGAPNRLSGCDADGPLVTAVPLWSFVSWAVIVWVPGAVEDVMQALAVPLASVVTATVAAPVGAGQGPLVKVTPLVAALVLKVMVAPEMGTLLASFSVAVAWELDVPLAGIAVGLSDRVTDPADCVSFRLA